MKVTRKQLKLIKMTKQKLIKMTKMNLLNRYKDTYLRSVGTTLTLARLLQSLLRRNNDRRSVDHFNFIILNTAVSTRCTSLSRHQYIICG